MTSSNQMNFPEFLWQLSTFRHPIGFEYMEIYLPQLNTRPSSHIAVRSRVCDLSLISRMTYTLIRDSLAAHSQFVVAFFFKKVMRTVRGNMWWAHEKEIENTTDIISRFLLNSCRVDMNFISLKRYPFRKLRTIN